MTLRPWQDEATSATTGDAAPLPALVGQGAGDIAAAAGSRKRVYQWIAPCPAGQLPDQSMFYRVQCADLSRTGIAFFSYEPLECEEIIAALGTTDDAVYVKCKVLENLPVADECGPRYHVRCQFVERYDAPVAHPAT